MFNWYEWECSGISASIFVNCSSAVQEQWTIWDPVSYRYSQQMSVFAGPPAFQFEIIPYRVYSEAQRGNLLLYRKLVVACYSCFACSKMSDEDFSRTSWQHCVLVQWRSYCFDASNAETKHFDTKEKPDYFPVIICHKANWTLKSALELHVFIGVPSPNYDARRQRFKSHRSQCRRVEFKCHSWWHQSRGIYTP